MDELNQVKVAQEQANDEKKSMMNGIVELQQQLSETNTMITKSKTEMNNISRDSALMVEQKIKELSSKDKEITQLMQEKNQYENDIQQLEMQSEKLKVALENSEQQKNQVQKMIDEIRKESEMTKKSNQENMNRLQNDLDVEREKFISQFAVLTEQLEQVKMETQEYVRNVSDQSMQEKEELQGTIADLQAELYQAKDRIDRAEKSVVEVRQTSDAKVEKIKKDADKFKGKMRNFSSVEKKELTRRVWDLEYKVGKAKYDVIIAQKEAKKLKAAALDHENEIKALEAIHEAEMKTLQQRLTTSEISYDKMRVEDRERMERIVTSFQKRMNRRENKAMSALKGLRNQVMNVFDVKGALTSSADDTFDATTSDLYDVIASVGMDVDTRNKDFGENINSLESILSDTIEGARKDFSDREEEYASNMEKLRKDAVAEREEIIAIKNIEIRKVEQENIRNLGSVRMEFTEKLNKSKGQISRMQNIIDEKDEIIHEYEAEKRSYRKLAGLAWRATKDKVSSRRRDGKK
jgi:chromosome segregation ATPase